MASIIDDLKMQYKFGGITQRLIYWNIACFLVSLALFYQFSLGIFDFPNWLALSSEPSVFIWNPWTLLTYAFFHDGFGHIFFNMIILNFSSTLFLTFFNQKQLLGLYVLSAMFAGLAFVLGFYFLHLNSSIVGASGAIMAILVAATTYSPLMNVRLLLVGNVKLWHITVVILLLDLMQIRLDNSGGHIAHLAGAFFGFAYVKFLENGTDLSKIVSSIIDFFVNLFKKSPSKPLKTVHKNYKKRSGYDCLTKEEKEFLFKAGK
jgi:membrane associated rhomboid family serine protease